MQAPGRPGSGPEAINKLRPARHSRVRASSAAAALRADGGGSGASTDSVYKSALEQQARGVCEKQFRSIKFLPLTRCQNIPRGPHPRPGSRGGAPGSGRPRGAPSPPPGRVRLPESASNFLPTAICLGGGEPRRDKEAARQAGGSGAALPRGSRAPAEAGKLARPTAFPFQRKRGPAAPHPAPGRWVGSRDLQAAGPGRDFRRGCGARRGRPRAPPAGRTSTSRAKPSTSLVAPQRQPTPGYHWAARRSCCQTTAGPPSRSHGPAGQKLLRTGGNNTLATAALRGQPEVRPPPPPATDTCSSQARCEAGEFGFSNPVVAFIKTEDL